MFLHSAYFSGTGLTEVGLQGVPETLKTVEEACLSETIVSTLLEPHWSQLFVEREPTLIARTRR